MSRLRDAGLVLMSALCLSCTPAPDGTVVRIPTGAGGVGFLPLLMMREHGLIEKHAAAAGMKLPPTSRAGSMTANMSNGRSGVGTGKVLGHKPSCSVRASCSSCSILSR